MDLTTLSAHPLWVIVATIVVWFLGLIPSKFLGNWIYNHVLGLVERLFHVKESDGHRHLTQNLVPFLFVVLFGVCLVWWASTHTPRATTAAASAPVSSTPVAASPVYYKTPLTLKQIFATDFPNNMTVGSESMLTYQPDNTVVHVSYLIILDFIARSRFIAYYLPRTPHAFEFCERLGRGSQETLDFSDQRQGITARAPGESSKTEMNDLQFSKRVYVYTEEDLTLREEANCEQIFLENGVSVEFRGQAWHTLHWQDKRAMTSAEAAAEHAKMGIAP